MSSVDRLKLAFGGPVRQRRSPTCSHISCGGNNSAATMGGPRDLRSVVWKSSTPSEKSPNLSPFQLQLRSFKPGLSKDRVSEDQLRLLGVTEHHLMETLALPFNVIGNAR